MILFFFIDPATTEIYTLSYTTLFRSGDPFEEIAAADEEPEQRPDDRVEHQPRLMGEKDDEQRGLRAGQDDVVRSEEHTSELQSQSNLVCRPPIEKKKTDHD